MIKREFRILGIDDSYKLGDKNTLVVGTIFRGGEWLDGVIRTFCKVDGNDSTKKIIELIRKSKHFGQLQCIMLNGIAVGGFNVINIHELWKKTKLPVIVVIRKKPNFKKIQKALKKINQQEKMNLIKKAGQVYSEKIKGKKIYFQTAGISDKKASEIIKISTTHSLIPEPIRISHIIASGIILGESKRRA